MAFWRRTADITDPDILLRKEAEKFARELAKAQIKSSQLLLSAGKFDEDNKENGWRQTLLMRPGYDEHKVDEVIEITRSKCQLRSEPYNFRAVILCLAAYEFQERTGFEAEDFEEELRTGVDSVLNKYHDN